MKPISNKPIYFSLLFCAAQILFGIHALAAPPNDSSVIQVVVGPTADGGYASPWPVSAVGITHGKVVFDNSNNAYFCNFSDNTVHMVSPAGLVSSIANVGCTDLAIDRTQDILYIAGYFDGTIRKIGLNANPLGLTTIISGLGGSGVSGLNIDPVNSSQYLYYVYQRICSYYKLDLTTGVSQRIAGSGSCGAAGPAEGATANGTPLGSAVQGIAADTQGNLYLYLSGLNQIWKVDNTGVLRKIAGTGTAGIAGNNGPALNAQLNYPDFGVLDGNGNLIFSERNNSVIRKIDLTTGNITALTGSLGSHAVSPNGTAYNNTSLPITLGIGIDNDGYYWITSFTGVRRFVPQAPLTITKTADKSQVNVGEQLTYTITIKNTSTIATALGAVLEDVVPSNLSAVT